MAQKFYTNIENSKTNWGSNYDETNHYPGHENVVEGCLQRIANATESMAHNFNSLINENESLKRRVQYRDERIERLERSIRTYKGVVTKLKNKLSKPTHQ